MKAAGLVPSLQAATSGAVEYSRGKVTRAAERTTGLVLSVLSSILTVLLVLTVSVFLYGTFYYAYVPIDVYKLPLDLQFQPCKESSGRCSYPTGNLSLGSNVRLYQGQSYSLSSSLSLPDNSVNEEHGMFMACLTISTAKGTQLRQACKSSRLQYRSALLRVLETLTFLPALLMGLSSQRQEIVIDFFDKFELDPLNPGEIIGLEIRSKSLEVSAVVIHIFADLKGLKLLMYRHPWISMVIGIGSNILILSSITLISWTKFLSPHSEARGHSETEQEELDFTDAGRDRLFLLKTVFLALIIIILLISSSAY